MKVTMKLGLDALELQVPDRMFARHISFRSRAAEETSASEWIAKSVDELRSSGFFSAAKKRVVGVLVADSTREKTYEAFLPALRDALCSAAEVRFFVCTGTHDPLSVENQELADALRNDLRQLSIPATVTVHDARARDLKRIGTTSRGTRVEFQPAAAECETFLVLANMKVHYFAGYSNPVKYYLPGLCGYETARGNHSLTLDDDSTFGRHPWHPNALRHDNPLAADMVEGFELLIGEREHFALAVVGSVEKPVWCGAGRTKEVAGRAMEAIDRMVEVEVQPTRFLVVSPGGYPHDESLYTAQRALELTRSAVLDGGEVLFLSACPNGVGTPAARRNFFDPLTRPLAEVCRRPEGEYVMYSHKAYKFGLYLAGLQRVHMLSEMSGREIESIHMAPAHDAQAVLDEWERVSRPGDAVTFIDDGSKFAPRRVD